MIAEGYIPKDDDPDRRFVSHETACILNAGERRTLHLRFNDLRDPERVPRETDYSCLIESDVPIVVQHTRLDSRRSDVALLSTIAYSE